MIKQIYQLACTPFLIEDWRKILMTYDWYSEPNDCDEFCISIEITEDFYFSIDPLGKEILSAILPFYYWEDYEPEWHENIEEYNRQLKLYNEEFELVKTIALTVLPPPFFYWTDLDEDRHKTVIWEGKHGILILQQACGDIQFGMEINLWLENCSKDEFNPKISLIDWLEKRSQNIRDRQGFPKICW